MLGGYIGQTIAPATESSAGLLSAADKTKLDALGTAATANTGTANGNVPVISGGTIPGSIIPTLNQNTTGTAANVTGTVAIASGGTGATTAATAVTNLGALSLAGGTMTGAINFGNQLLIACKGIQDKQA